MLKTSKFMVKRQVSFTRLLALALLLFVSGCAAPLPLRPGEMTIADIETSRLSFLKNSVTSKIEVKTHLGPPTFTVAKESIWGYRMTLYSHPRHLPISSHWRKVDYSKTLAATPDLHVQRSLDSELTFTPESSLEAATLIFPYELLLVFDESSRLKVFRVFDFRNGLPR